MPKYKLQHVLLAAAISSLVVGVLVFVLMQIRLNAEWRYEEGLRSRIQELQR